MKIKIDPAKKVTLYNPEFDEMRHALDMKIQKTLKSMLASNMDSASIGMKIDISMIKEVIKDNNAPTGEREAMKPEISARIVSAMQKREDTKVKVVGRTSNLEVLIDDDGNISFVSKEEASGQLSMFNSWDEFKEAAEAETKDGDAENNEEAEDEDDE